MSCLIRLENLSQSASGRSLFSDISFSILSQARIGLVGANGTGKSTLLKILAGISLPDQGSVIRQKDLCVAYVPQESLFKEESVLEVVVQAYLAHFPGHFHEEALAQARKVLSKTGFTDFTLAPQHLSGGWKKRLEIARQVILQPDLLLLDEPTNHLDLNGILWLEGFLQHASFAYVVISHDRYFLKQITNQMMELGKQYPKGLFVCDGNYELFLERRDLFLEGQAEYERSLASKARRELAWLRQGAKARTTKSRSRTEAAHALFAEHNAVQRRMQTSTVQMQFSDSGRQSRKLVSIHRLTKTLGDSPLFLPFDLTLHPGMRLGIAGANGTGKSTLLKIIAGQLSPTQGNVKVADGVKVLLFDQHRESLPLDIPLRLALAPYGDRVNYRGESIHVSGWAQRFLFSPDRLELPVRQLSGGEKARVLLSRMMLQPADVLLLDEPTNDLDIPTLEVLEETLTDFPGAVMLVTHDRYMLDTTCNAILGLSKGKEPELLASYEQWCEHEEMEKEAEEKEKKLLQDKEKKREDLGISPPKQEVRKKLSFREQKELEEIEPKILQLEKSIHLLETEIGSASLADNPALLQQKCQALHAAEEAMQKLYLRWQELEERR